MSELVSGMVSRQVNERGKCYRKCTVYSMLWDSIDPCYRKHQVSESRVSLRTATNKDFRLDILFAGMVGDLAHTGHCSFGLPPEMVDMIANWSINAERGRENKNQVLYLRSSFGCL